MGSRKPINQTQVTQEPCYTHYPQTPTLIRDRHLLMEAVGRWRARKFSPLVRRGVAGAAPNRKPLPTPDNIRYSTHSLFDMFRANMPPGFARGRRFPRNLSHAAISGWTAEECLVFLRIEWRYICSQFLHMWHESGKETPEIFQVVMEGLTLFSNAIAPFLDRRGCQSSMEQLRDAAVKYVRHMVHAQVDGQRVYSCHHY